MEEGGVTVCVRVRPLIARENEDLDEKGQVSWKSEDCTVSQIDGTRSFVFDRVFHSDSSTKEVYQGVTAPIIKSAVQGYNGTIFAYGQTASGKTYTILGTKDSPGILPMAINNVFNTICRIPDREFLLRISYMEIHNETIQDLLCSNIRKKKSLVVREDINRTIYVEDLNEEVVVSPEEVMTWLKKGEKNRHYGETKMNERSSRSHTIFRMIIESKEKHTSGSSYEGAVMVSHLNFVDLAGSERASQTGTEGIRLKEGCNINRSLFILGQVIKKLCDDQSGGFINYRDSKLTRILQNSLGGNAKTVIICTITPASLEETLSTLQFASTAKKMKNTPKVNEVLDDDALLKRYRKEIEDLKRQLEEVSSHSHTKDQLAQLLEEKNSVQKEQQDRIRALTEMLVTASSFLQERELKAKKKRRVTWAPGPLSQDGGMPFLEEFPNRAKRFKTSLSSVTEMEESVSSEFSEYDDQCMTASIIMPEEEWIPRPEINFTSKDFAEPADLCQSLLEERDNAVTEQQAIKAKLDSVCLEKEQLAYELKELREKISTSEFVALEKQASKEQEMQLMHEITILKDIISNAEIYNQDLQQEINSKDMQYKEQQERITVLEEHNKKLESFVEFKKDKNDATILVQTPRKSLDEVQELKQSLRDAEAVALDAKKESAFLRSENLTLKEKMNQLSDTYNQMEKDLGSLKTQLEAGKVTYKKMQSDLQKELQYYFQENAKLTSLVEVNNSKDLQPCMDLEGKMGDLKNDLHKALEENVSLKEKITALSEANSGSDLEILHKEIVEKNETIALLMSEKEMLLSQVAEKERMVHEATQALASKMDLAKDEVIRENTVAFEELRQPCDKLEQISFVVAEENKSMKTQIDSCSNESLNTSISYIIQEQSSKNGELQEKDLEQEVLPTLKEQLDEAHQKLNEMEELKDQLKVWESKMETEEAQKLDMMQRLQEGKEKIRVLTEERNDLKQKQEALEKERDQLKEDIQDTIYMNIEAQEGFMNAQNSLKQCQKHIKELEETIAEKDKQISRAKETFEITTDDQKQQILQILQILKLTDNLEDVSVKKLQNEEDINQIVLDVNNELQHIKGHITTLQQEKMALQHQLENLEKEKNQYLESNQMLQTKSFDLQQSLQMNQQNVENFDDTDQLKISFESQMEVLQKEKAELVQKLHSTEEDIKYISQEKKHLRIEVEILQAEKDTITQTVHHLDKTIEKLIPTNLELQEQLKEANNSLSEHKEMVEELKGKIIATDSLTSKIHEELKQKAEDTQLEQEKLLAYVKLQEHEVNTQKNLVLEKEQMFQKIEEEFKEETKKLKGKIQHLENNSFELQQLLRLKEEENQQNVGSMKDAEQLKVIPDPQMEALQREKAELVQKLQCTEENVKYISQEKEHLRTEMEVLQTEKDNMVQTVHRLSETIEKLVPVNLELQQELREANNSLREHKEMVKELKEKIISTDFQTLKIHEELKKKSEDSQLELEKLLMYVKSQEDEVNTQKNLVLEKQQMFQKLEEEIKEETKHLKEKIIKSNEEISSLTEEKKQLTAELREQEKCIQQLLKEKSLLQKERDELMQNSGEKTQSQLQETLSEKTAKITKLNEEVSSLTEEKKQLTAELRDHEKYVQQLLKEKTLLQKERDDLQQGMQNIREETQSQLQESLSENVAKIIKSNEEVSSLTKEKKQLTDELREQEKYVQQLLKEKTLLQKERDDLQQVMQNIRKETKSQFQETLSENTAKDSERNVKKMKDCFEILEEKIFRITEVLKKFPELKKRSEYFINISLQIKNQFDSKKALIAKWLPDISPQEANHLRRLQIENERISNSLYGLLNKLQYFFACLCDKRKEYYTNVSKYTKELLDERRNQHVMQMQVRQLRKPHLEQQGEGSQQSGVSGLIQSLDGLTEQISKEVSEMEEELSGTEVTLQELERENIEMEQYLEQCSDHFDLQGFEATIKQNIEKFRSINQFLQPKAQPYFQVRSELEAINANYCREIDATLEACRKETKELILQLDMLKKEQKSCGVANKKLEEEDHKLVYKMNATEQDSKNLQLKIQELESIINEGRKNLQEKEKIIATLEMKLKVRASRSEVVRLQTALEEKENCLRNALSERETLKAQVDKGVGLYKEEIEDLKTQLAKADMARMKQSKLFDREIANAKALADHREEQLRKLKEELRKAQQEQDVTVMSNKDLPQPSLPITCGGGSGIVQNTHMLVLKSEHAKLEKEYAQLKKEHELLLTNGLSLKEEIKKWKERAMKKKERALGDTAEEHKTKSPKKVSTSSLSALPASPCRERFMQPILPSDTPQLMPSNSQANFFDNSRLGITANTRPGRTESEENDFKHWLSSDDKGDVSNCKTQ